MADWNVGLAEPQASGASPVAPVKQAGFGDLLETGASIVGSLLKGKAESDKEKAEKRNKAIIEEYSQKYSAITDSESRGLSSGQKLARTQALFRQYVASAPDLIKEFKDITGGMQQYGSVAEDIDVVKSAKEERDYKITELSKRGFVASRTDAPETIEAMWQINQNAVKLEKLAEERIKVESHGASMAQAQRSAIDFRIKNDARVAVMEMGNSYIPVMQTKADEILKDFKSGKYKTPDEALSAWNVIKNSYDSTVRTASQGEEGLANGWINLGNTLDANFRDQLTGKTLSEEQKNRNALVLGAAQSKLLQAPGGAEFFAASQMSPAAVDKMISVMPTDTVKNILTFATGSGSVRDAKTAEGVAIMNNSVADTYTKTKSVEASREAAKLFNKSLKELTAQDVYGADPATFKHLISSIDNPVFAEKVKTGEIGVAERSNASAVAARIWKEPLVQKTADQMGKEFTFSASGQSAPFSDIVDIGFVNGKIIFTPKSPKSGYLSPVDAQDQRQIVRELASYSEAVSQLVRIDSYMQGEIDVGKTWEARKHEYFPAVFPNPQTVQPGKVYEMNGKKFKYNGGIPWKSEKSWEEVKGE